MKRLIPAGMLALGLISLNAEAQSLYVSDELVITFRTGPGNQYAISKNISSGARVEVLEELEEEGYARVRLQDGSEGWVLTRYLQADQPAALKLDAATRQLASEREKVAELEQRLAELETSMASTSQALEASQSSAQEMSSELTEIRSASANALQTRQQNEELRRQLDELTASAQVAALEIDQLRGRERQNWFIIGAAVLLGGVIIGLIAPSLRPKRRSSW